MTNGTQNPDLDCKVRISILQKERTLNVQLLIIFSVYCQVIGNVFLLKKYFQFVVFETLQSN